MKNKKLSPSTRALLQHLLKGKTLSIRNGFFLYGFSSISRELPRKVEVPFGIYLDRKRMPFKSRFGELGYYFDYSLNKKDYAKVKKLL